MRVRGREGAGFLRPEKEKRRREIEKERERERESKEGKGKRESVFHSTTRP